MLYDDAVTKSNVALANRLNSDFLERRIALSCSDRVYDFEKGKDVHSVSRNTYLNEMISKEEVQRLNSSSKNGHIFAGVYSNNLHSNRDYQIKSGDDFVSPSSTVFYSCSFINGFVDCDEEYMGKNGFNLIAGVFPENSNEIAISEYQAHIVMDTLRLRDYSQVVGKELKITSENSRQSMSDVFVISGVYDVGPLDSIYEAALNEDRPEVTSDYYRHFVDKMSSSFNCVAFVSSSFYHDRSALFDNESRFSTNNNLPGGGLIVSGNNHIQTPTADDNTYALISKFNSVDLFRFYDLDMNPVAFAEPHSGEVYASKKGVESSAVNKFINNITIAVKCIKEATSKSLLPELESSAIYGDNGHVLDDILNTLRYAINPKDGYVFSSYRYSDDVQKLLRDYYPTAFNRLYISTMYSSMKYLNDIGGFGFGQFQSGSFLEENYGKYVTGRVKDFDKFIGMYDYILDDANLAEFANRVLHYYVVRHSDWKEVSKARNEIENMITQKKGASIGDEKWNDFLHLANDYIDSKDGFVGSFFSDGLYLLSKNCRSLDYEAPLISLDVKIEYPSVYYYRNVYGKSGQLKVAGYYENLVESSYTSDSLFFSGTFFSTIANVPNQVNYVYYDSFGVQPSSGEYSYVITKTNFSTRQVKELNANYGGHYYAFKNSNLEEADIFAENFRAFFVFVVIASIATGVFSSLLLSSYIFDSVNRKNKDIGILRSLGARNLDVCKIFILESAALTFISTLIASVLTILACAFINSFVLGEFGFLMLNFTFLNFLLIFAIAMVISLLASTVPLLVMSRKSPSAIIRGK